MQRGFNICPGFFFFFFCLKQLPGGLTDQRVLFPTEIVYVNGNLCVAGDGGYALTVCAVLASTEACRPDQAASRWQLNREGPLPCIQHFCYSSSVCTASCSNSRRISLHNVIVIGIPGHQSLSMVCLTDKLSG